ncbi:helicase [Leucobacter sp. UCMA 4100]|uniref:helicase-related protein n=1 Tax=Leucobacter sp. UCMA 4100 TaxID=2810534 RepID=UPI0022EAD0D7|nr:helicase-related protein [Leucobacter sp. UCMA 4100]MDA3146506.1 helicase [Leucobacter sp. UCMA 4100]
MFDQLGVPAGSTILEPGCGTGNFLGKARDGDNLVGIELDPTTAQIATLLHPDAIVKNESFAETRLEGDGFDAAIGNVPFSPVKPFDPAYNAANLSLHNAFIVKSLRLTKPGGIVAVMSSRWTMDSKTSSARRHIAQYGELLGAVRMPQGAHGAVAGTEAVIDVLVFKRHEGEPPHTEPTWVKTVPFTTADGEAFVNPYFINRPEHVLGDLRIRSGQFGPEITVRTPNTAPESVAVQLGTALKQISAEALEAGKGWNATNRTVTDRPVAAAVQDPEKLVGRIYEDESGHLMQVGIEGPDALQIPKNAEAEMRALLQMRDASVALLNAEAATAEDTPQIASLRAELNRNYDSYLAQFGPLGRFSETVRERPGKDALITRKYPAALRAFRVDPHYATVVALERYNEDTHEARKATIFFERVVGAQTLISHVETPEDAIQVSLDRLGVIDVALVAELLDLDEDAVPEALGDRVFLSPKDRSTYISREEYLSGNVRQKRYEAMDLAEEDDRFNVHVAALQKVIPVELGPAEIDTKLGASWVPRRDVKEFLEHVLTTDISAIEYIDGKWNFRQRGRTGSVSEARWSVRSDITAMSAYVVVKKVLNGEKLQVTYTVDDRTFVDQEATEMLQEKAGELHETFQDWLWSDAARAEELQTRYNDLYNGIVLRSYDDITLSLPGKAATFTPHPHQYAAVARMLAEPSVGLFHEVGAGKTAEMVMGVMELRRLGFVQKPAIVVPNQMLEQFTREFKQIYPRAKVLAAGSQDVSSAGGRDARKLFIARAQTGDWDAVIMTHTAFEKVGLGKAQAEYAKQKLEELQAVHLEKLNSDLSKNSVKTIERQLATQEEKLSKMLDIDHDEGISWEETGIDYLCIDEAHYFKNLAVNSSIDDLNRAQGAQRAQDLDMKLWYHRDHLKQSRVATLATATPLPNSMIEMYVMMRYLRPDLLEDAQVFRADDWAKQFTEQTTAVEAKPEGNGFQIKTRTTKFRNLPELLQMWHTPGDVKTQADLNLAVPTLALNEEGERTPIMVAVEPTEAQQLGMETIVERAVLVRDRMVEPEEDNMLKITSDGRAVALDPRLRGGDGPTESETTKIEVVADTIFEEWERNRGNEYLDEWGEPSEALGGLQIVFSDLGTPKQGGAFDVYNELRRLLVDKGMKADRVRFVHDASNDQAKAELFQQCRDGRVDVLIGSTDKMGIGTNVQTRAVALHHIDAPWRPADVTQREGRIIRQGNQNSDVQIYRYSTEGSFDAYMWGTLARKAQFIEQVLSRRLDVREIDDSGTQALQFSEMQAVTLGDMRILEVANLKQEVQKLGRQHRSHNRMLTAATERQKAAEQQMAMYQRDLSHLEDLVPKLVSTNGDSFRGTLQENVYRHPVVMTSRKAFSERLSELVTQARMKRQHLSEHTARYPAPVELTVTVGGVEWATRLKHNVAKRDDPIVVFEDPGAPSALSFEVKLSVVTGDATGSNAARFETRAQSVPHLVEKYRDLVVARSNDAKELRQISEVPWPKQAEFNTKKTRLDALEAQLQEEATPKQAVPGTPTVHKPLPQTPRVGY